MVGETAVQPDLFRIHSAPHPGTFFIGPVRVRRTQPEAEGVIRVSLGHKCSKTFIGVVVSGRVSFPVAYIARTPAFTETADLITRIFQQQGIHGSGRIQGAPEVGTGPQPPMVLSCEDGIS